VKFISRSFELNWLNCGIMHLGLDTDFEHANALVHLLIDHATGSSGSDYDFSELRDYFVLESNYRSLLPSWFPSMRSLNQFWQFIKNEYSTYAERRQFLWSEFEPLLSACETRSRIVAQVEITEGLFSFDSDCIERAWKVSLSRVENDPEGAITSARSLLESVFKHILEQNKVQYDAKKIKFNKLHRLAAEALNLAPEQHDEGLFKQILGGCSNVVNGMASLRNSIGDAHGKTMRYVKPNPRHARLVVNLAGAMALFFVETANKD